MTLQLTFSWKNLKNVKVLVDILGNTGLDDNLCFGNTIRAQDMLIIFLKIFV